MNESGVRSANTSQSDRGVGRASVTGGAVLPGAVRPRRSSPPRDRRMSHIRPFCDECSNEYPWLDRDQQPQLERMSRRENERETALLATGTRPDGVSVEPARLPGQTLGWPTVRHLGVRRAVRDGETQRIGLVPGADLPRLH